MTPQGQNGLRKGAREFAALGLWALGVYTVLSLSSHDIGREPNLGRPLGGALARTLERAFGHVAYVVAGPGCISVTCACTPNHASFCSRTRARPSSSTSSALAFVQWRIIKQIESRQPIDALHSVVTLFKLAPGEGVKVSKIASLADDLSLALRAPSVRILAPIPGEAAVGIELANIQREAVYLKELLKTGEFKTAASQLTIALGKDIAGRPVWADLASMPHLLIAGATGTGKSVSIHAMLASILFKAITNDVRFILIDPKMLELSVYEGIPHS